MKLADTDIDIGRIAWGCWRLLHDDIDALLTILSTLRDCGIKVLDNAAVYGYGTRFGAGHAETMLGRTFRAEPSLRREFTVITKAGLELPTPYNSSATAIVEGCDASLQRLDIDAIDIFMIHRPDLLTHAAEVAGALNTLHAAGKIRHVAVSNHQPSEVAALAAFLEVPISCHQIELSAWQTSPLDNGVLDQCQQLGMTPMAWSPLAGGILAGEVQADSRVPPALDRLRSTIADIAAEHDCAAPAIAMAFVLKIPGVMPVIGTQRPGRIRAACAAVDIMLSRRDWYRILESRRGIPMP